MTDSILGSLAPDDRRKYRELILLAKKTFLEIDDAREYIKESAKKHADENGVDKKALVVAAKTAYKDDLESKQADLAAVSEILGEAENEFVILAKKAFQEIDDARESFNDYVKNLADEMNVDKKALMMACKTAYKDDLQSKQEDLAVAAEILEAAGV